MERYFIGTKELKLTRIEVFNCSKLAVPYYHLENMYGDEKIIGGNRIGSLKEMNSPEFEARDSANFMLAIRLADDDTIPSSYATDSLHRKVSDTHYDGYVHLDVYETEVEDLLYLEFGASNVLYNTDENGGVRMVLAGLESGLILTAGNTTVDTTGKSTVQDS